MKNKNTTLSHRLIPSLPPVSLSWKHFLLQIPDPDGLFTSSNYFFTSYDLILYHSFFISSSILYFRSIQVYGLLNHLFIQRHFQIVHDITFFTSYGLLVHTKVITSTIKKSHYIQYEILWLFPLQDYQLWNSCRVGGCQRTRYTWRHSVMEFSFSWISKYSYSKGIFRHFQISLDLTIRKARKESLCAYESLWASRFEKRAKSYRSE